jgi:riboflavin kinase/FMN adenylyltransferase
MNKLIDGIEKITKKYRYPVLAIGNFDGVHVGHQTIFRKLVARAGRMKGTSIVCTFEPHPLRIIAPERSPKLLTTFREKIRLINKMGVDMIVCVNFTREFSNIRAEDFVHEVLCRTFEVKEVFIGSNYRFGKGRKGSPELLKKLGKECGFKVTVIDEVQLHDITVSSSRIRTLIAKGRIDESSVFLGRHYSVIGIVIEGAKRGKSLLNIPTANIAVFNELLPKDGVYAVTVELDGKTYGGAANIGYNPTFEEKKFSFEVHILDFDRRILGKTLRVNFIKRIRDEMKFSSAAELKTQLKKDISDVKNILAISHEQPK